MRYQPTAILAVSALLTIFAAIPTAIAGDVAIVKDIGRLGYGSYPTGFFELPSGRVLFTAADGPHGRELWTTDGTGEGTRLLLDLVPGTTGSTQGFYSFYLLGGQALFFANPQFGVQELWRTDGTPEHTARLAQWSDASVGVSVLATVGERLLFSTSINGTTGLYASDGTATTPALLAPGLSLSSGGSKLNYDGSLVFAGRTSTAGTELWRTNGLASGTRMISDLYPGAGSSNPTQLVLYRSLLYFTATTAATGMELFRTDGTTQGTALALDLVAGPIGSSPRSLVVSGDYLYFAGPTIADPANDVLYAYSPETGTIDLFYNLVLDADIGQIVAAGPGVAFSAPDRLYSDTTGIWTIDAISQNGVMQLTGDYSPVGISFIQQFGNGWFIRRNGNVDFTDVFSGTATTIFPSGAGFWRLYRGRALFSKGTTDTQFWLSDGTVQGTTRIATERIVPGLGTALPLADGSVVYQSSDITGNEPWITDGASGASRRLRNIDLRTYGVSSLSGFSLNGRFYFYDGGASGSAAIWSCRGSPDTTSLSVDVGTLSPGQSNSPSENVVLGSWLYLPASVTVGTGQYSRLYRTDGTLQNTQLIMEATGSFRELLAVGNEVWFRRQNSGGGGDGLYRTDGTPGGTRLVTTQLRETLKRFSVGTGAVYLALDYLPGESHPRYRIWYCDGTEAGTRVLWTAPSVDGQTYWHTGVGTAAYFLTDNFAGGADRYQLMRADQSGGVSVVASFPSLPDLVGSIGNGDIAFFASPAGSVGLYRTVGGTSVQRVAPILSRTLCSSGCATGASLNGVLYFSADTGTNGELWRTDGTSAGTYRVIDLYPGPGGSTPRNFFSDGQMLYFVANTQSNVTELWKSDGTAAGTRQVHTFWKRPGLPTDPKVLGSSDDGVFFTADNEFLGIELHVHRPGLPDCNRNLIHDAVDLEVGLSIDANGDGLPDECCAADFNSDGQASLQDLFDYLTAWFAGDSLADGNRSGDVTLQDLFDYLGVWFTGCV